VRAGARAGARAGTAGHHQALIAVRFGVFGGTFDPPHVGHLLAASDAFDLLTLDRLFFVPAARQPFKDAQVHAAPEQRARMVELMIGGDARFAVDRSEIARPGLSYTADTLAELAARHAGAELFLLIGSDLAAQIGTWREPARIASLCEIVVLARSGEVPAPPADSPPMRRLATRRVEVSSSEVRERVRTGKPIEGFVAEPVARFIRDAGLYQ
jgi:nicotinate-nucleotide adenylyltransferase